MPTRNSTTTATQALLLINGSWTQARARALADRIDRQVSQSCDEPDSRQIIAAFRLAYGRAPDGEELSAATATTGLGIALLAAGLSAAVAPLNGQLPLWGTPLLLVVVAVPFVLFSGYVLPRWLTSHRATQVAEFVRPILKPWARALSLFLPEPARRHAADVRALWREGAAGALGSSEELLMVGNVITFAQRSIREVMTPRPELVAIPEEAGYDEVQQAFTQSGYSRLPVYRASIDEVVGMVHVFDLLKVEAAYQRLPGGEMATRDVVDAILEEAARFSEQVLAPLNASGDEEGCHLDKATAEVTTPKGFKEAYATYAKKEEEARFSSAMDDVVGG